MTDANYQRFFKVLGKLAYLYDTATAENTALATLLATTADQVATGLSVDNPAVLMLAQNLGALSVALVNGPQAIQSQAIAIASAYLELPLFKAALTTVPTANTAAAILIALATEMTSVSTTKTLTTKSATGLVNFFDTIAGSSGSWNTAAPGDYPDATYCVSAIV
jgi:hypothetical protein